MSQIERNWDDELISEVAVRCNDAMYRDFRKDLYGQAVFREQRLLAQQYKVLERRWSTYIGQENLNVRTKWGTLVLNEIPITATDFNSEYEVLLNGTALKKQNNIDELKAGDYYIRYTKDDADLRDLYSIIDHGYNKIKDQNEDNVAAADSKIAFSTEYNYVVYVLSDKELVKEDYINIYYTSTGRLANETTGKPVLPVKFYEELLRKSILNIAKLGIVSFTGEKKQRYADILGIYGAEDRRGSKSKLERNDAWVHVKPFTIY